MLMSPRQPVAYWTYLIWSCLFSTSLNHMTVSNTHTHTHIQRVTRCYLFVSFIYSFIHLFIPTLFSTFLAQAVAHFRSIVSLLFCSLLLVSCIELSLTGSAVAMVIDSAETRHFFSSERKAKTGSTLLVGQKHETSSFICFCSTGFSSNCYMAA